MHPQDTLPPEDLWPVAFDEQLFAELYPHVENTTLGELFGMSRAAIALRGSRRHLLKIPVIPDVSDEEFAALYPTTKNADLAERLGRSIPYVEKRANALALYKTKEHWSQVHLGQQNSLGREDSEETRYLKHVARVGPLNPNWKGGVSITNQSGRTHYGMKEWRRRVLERDHGQCAWCGDKMNGLARHHRFGYIAFPTLRAQVWNGITLCRKCHKIANRRDRQLNGRQLLPVLN